MKGKSKLTKKEMEEFLSKAESIDKKLDHSRAYRTLMNVTRRNILKFIGYEIRNMEQLQKEFNLNEDQLEYHLSMLDQCLYIINSHEGWKATPRGLGFLENAKISD